MVKWKTKKSRVNGDFIAVCFYCNGGGRVMICGGKFVCACASDGGSPETLITASAQPEALSSCE